MTAEANQSQEAFNPDHFSADEVEWAAQFDANPNDLTQPVPEGVDEVQRIIELGDAVVLSPQYDTEGKALDSFSASKVVDMAQNGADAWVIPDDDSKTRGRLSFFANKLVDSTEGGDIKLVQPYEKLGDDTKRQILKMQDAYEAVTNQEISVEQAALLLRQNASQRLNLSRALKAQNGAAQTPQPEPEPAKPPKNPPTRQDDRNRRGHGGNRKGSGKSPAGSNPQPAPQQGPAKPTPANANAAPGAPATPFEAEKGKFAQNYQAWVDAGKPTTDKHFNSLLRSGQDSLIKEWAKQNGLNTRDPATTERFRDEVLAPQFAEVLPQHLRPNTAQPAPDPNANAPQPAPQPTPKPQPTPQPPVTPATANPNTDPNADPNAAPRLTAQETLDAVKTELAELYARGGRQNPDINDAIDRAIRAINNAAIDEMPGGQPSTIYAHANNLIGDMYAYVSDLENQYPHPADPNVGNNFDPADPANNPVTPPQPPVNQPQPVHTPVSGGHGTGTGGAPTSSSTSPNPSNPNAVPNAPSPLEYAQNTFLEAYESHLRNGGSLNDPDFVRRTDDLWDAVLLQFKNEMLAHSIDPDSDTGQARLVWLSEIMGSRVDDLIDRDPPTGFEGAVYRIKKIFGKANTKLAVGVATVATALSPAEMSRRSSRRKKIIGGAVGVAVLGLVGWKFSNNIIDAVHGAGDAVTGAGNTIGINGDEAAGSGGNGGDGGGQPPEAPEAPEAPPDTPPTPEVHHATVESGDNVWKLVTEGNGGDDTLTGNMIIDGQVSVTDASGNVRVVDLNNPDSYLVHAGDTVNFTVPTTGGSGQAAQEAAGQAANNPNVEVLPEYNSQTGAGTVSGATLDQLHNLDIDIPSGGVFDSLVDKVVEYNEQQKVFNAADVTSLPVGQEVHFPPQKIMEEWLRQLEELEKSKVKS